MCENCTYICFMGEMSWNFLSLFPFPEKAWPVVIGKVGTQIGVCGWVIVCILASYAVYCRHVIITIMLTVIYTVKFFKFSSQIWNSSSKILHHESICQRYGKQNPKLILSCFFFFNHLFLFAQTILSKVIYIAFRVYNLSVHALPGNPTHDLCFPSVMIYSLNHRNASVQIISTTLKRSHFCVRSILLGFTWHVADAFYPKCLLVILFHWLSPLRNLGEKCRVPFWHDFTWLFHSPSIYL